MAAVVLLLFLLTLSPIYSTHVPQEAIGTFKNMVSAYVEECRSASGANAEIITGWLVNDETPNDDHLKRYIKCTYDKLGVINQDETLNFKAIEDLTVHLPGGDTRIAEQCAKIAETVGDIIEKTYKLETCLNDKFAV